MAPAITSVEISEFPVTFQNIGRHERGLKRIYEPDSVSESSVNALRIETDEGVTGEYVGFGGSAKAQIQAVSPVLIGKNPLERERLWTELRHILRQNYIGFDMVGLGPIDIALWDLAGTYYDAPIHELLGTYRKRLPAYASTTMGDDNGGLDSPEAYAAFAEECLELGYPAFKIHGWIQNPEGGVRKHQIEREIETIEAVSAAVGDEMDLMLDPACEYETFGEAVKVGNACAENDFFWFEDPYKDGGNAHYGHRKLRELVDVPLLQAEFVRDVEATANFLLAEATDFLRADPLYDSGITGAMKIARAAEAFGVDVEIHGAGPACRQCMAAIRNTNYYEMSLLHPDADNIVQLPIYASDYEDSLEAIDSDGTVSVPDGPGLGVEYDWDYIEGNLTDRRTID